MIISRTNPRVKEIRSLQVAKYRRERGEYFVEGVRGVEEALACPQEVKRIAYSPRLQETERGSRLLSRLRREASGAEWLYLDDPVLDFISATQNHQGILAVLRRRESPPEELYRREGILLLLHQIQDPGNLGAILRVAAGGGAAGLILSRGAADPFSPKVVRAAMGGQLRLPFLLERDLEGCIGELRARGYFVWASAPRAGRSLWEVCFTRSAAVLFGPEGEGLPPGLLAAADDLFSIPMTPGVDSLNVAMAAGIVIYEARRQKELTPRGKAGASPLKRQC